MNTRTFITLTAIVALAPNLVAQTQRPLPDITIIDQAGRIVPNDVAPSVTSQIFDVTVAPGGSFSFSPSNMNISVGDTVRWTWASSGHSVTSGNPCTPDLQFCSPNDMNCAAGSLSNTGTVYQHTFNQTGTFSYFCAAHCAFGMTGMVQVAPTCTPPPSGMVCWWPGDGNANDIQDGNDGTLENGATFAPGFVEQAFSFDGVAAQVTVPHNANQNTGSQITVDAWVYPTALSSNQTIIQKRSASNVGGFTFETSAPDGLAWFIMIGGVYHLAATSTSVLTLNTWQHVAATYDGSMMKIYVNGAEVASMAQTGPIDAVTDPIVIGRNVVVPSDAWQGLIDEVELLNRALSQAEIQAIVNAGSAGKCKPPQPAAAFSRKTHGAAGTFDIPVLLTSNVGIECRSGTNGYQMIIDFMNPVTVDSASVTSGTGTVSSFSVNGSEVTVNLTGVINIQRITMTLHNVNDGTQMGDVPVSMSVLIGDTNANGTVNAADVAQTKSRLGQSVDVTNFRSDVNANGSINAADTAIVKQNSGTSLPP